MMRRWNQDALYGGGVSSNASQLCSYNRVRIVPPSHCGVSKSHGAHALCSRSDTIGQWVCGVGMGMLFPGKHRGIDHDPVAEGMDAILASSS